MYDIIKNELGKYFKIVSNMWLPVLDSHRPRHDFSLKYQYNMKQTNNKKIRKYQLGDYYLMEYQVLKTNIILIIWQTVRRMTEKILGVKGLKPK